MSTRCGDVLVLFPLDATPGGCTARRYLASDGTVCWRQHCTLPAGHEGKHWYRWCESDERVQIERVHTGGRT